MIRYQQQQQQQAATTGSGQNQAKGQIKCEPISEPQSPIEANEQNGNETTERLMEVLKSEQRHRDEQAECASVLSSLGSHISMMGKERDQLNQHPGHLVKRHAGSPQPAPGNGTGRNSSSVSSTGYHSAASSPTSSILSPVSSSSASSPSSSASTGSGSPNSTGCSPSSSSALSGKLHSQQQQQNILHRIHSSTSPTSSSQKAGSSALSLVSQLVPLKQHSLQQLAQYQHNQQQSSTGSTCNTTGNGIPSGSVSGPTSGAKRNPTASGPHLAGAGAAHLFDYFPETNQDGLKLTWFHDTNSRARLTEALNSNKMLICGDISLAEMSRYPLPIMARPPLGASDIMLENWLQDALRVEPQRGLKLTFTSTRTVEPAFRVLARHAERIKGPLILAADILTRPNQNSALVSGQANRNSSSKQQAGTINSGQQPVDAWTFLMLCRTRFPESIISIGWCSSTAATSATAATTTAAATAAAVVAAAATLATGSNSPQLSATDQQQQLTGNSEFHSSTDSIFELDMLVDSGPQQQEAQSLAAIAAAVAQNASKHPYNHQIGHLSSQLSQHLSSSQRLHPYPLAHHHNSQHRQHRHSVHSLANLTSQQQLQLHQLQNHHHHHQQHHHILSSSASLNSSSGNSSGSSSPTSPVGQLLSPQLGSGSSSSSNGSSKISISQDPKQANQLQHFDDHHQHQLQLIQSNSNAAAAAAIAAAVAAASSVNQHHYQQLPLNLNINEAHQSEQQQQQQQHQQLGGQTLSELAHKIQSYQMISQQQKQSSGCFAPSNVNALLIGARHGQPLKVTNAKQSAPNRNLQLHQRQQQLLLKTTSQPAVGGITTALANSSYGYTREMIDKMASVVKEYNLTQPVTFPVEAKLLVRSQQSSLPELQRLLHQVGANSTLTVVAQHDDLISLEDILTIRKAFGANQLLFDLPEELASSFRHQFGLM